MKSFFILECSKIKKYLNIEECIWARVYGVRKEIFTDIIKIHGFQYKLKHNILVNNY